MFPSVLLQMLKILKNHYKKGNIGNPLTTSVPHRTETSLLCKSIDWFLYDGEHWSLMGQAPRLINLFWFSKYFYSRKFAQENITKRGIVTY